jgi:hypothetical protein
MGFMRSLLIAFVLVALSLGLYTVDRVFLGGERRKQGSSRFGGQLAGKDHEVTG